MYRGRLGRKSNDRSYDDDAGEPSNFLKKTSHKIESAGSPQADVRSARHEKAHNRDRRTGRPHHIFSQLQTPALRRRPGQATFLEVARGTFRCIAPVVPSIE
jgi:hypothetical protein